MKPIPSREPHSRLRLQSGFTLVEMLLVLVILSILGAIIYQNYSGHAARARIIATQAQIRTFRSALTAYEMDNDHFPEGKSGLVSLVQRPREAKNWRGPYLDGALPRDPWGNEYL